MDLKDALPIENMRYKLIRFLRKSTIARDEAEALLDDYLEINGAPVLHVAKKDGTVAKIIGKLAIEEYRRDNKVIEINRVIYEQKMKNKELEELGLL